ncbi:MAG: hypothetical protein DRN03_04170 [Thermoplasmata archaeon]|nr:MAG: hypothetical protein DRN03_04170 [Thermoplasmata archaeon]
MNKKQALWVSMWLVIFVGILYVMFPEVLFLVVTLIAAIIITWASIHFILYVYDVLGDNDA